MKVKYILYTLAIALTAMACGNNKKVATLVTPEHMDAYSLSRAGVTVGLDPKGRLTTLSNSETGLNYAGGDYLWRLYYDTHEAKEIQILAKDQKPSIKQGEDSIVLTYEGLQSPVAQDLAFKVVLTISIDENGLVHFDSALENNEKGTIIRELHYPLVGSLQVPDTYSLLTTETGGALYKDYRKMIWNASVANQSDAYKNQAQKFRQYDVKYPSRIKSNCAANCFAFLGDEDGLYFGSHDATFQDTWHGLRLYPDAKGEFTRLEAGFFKYPQILCGETWECNANCIKPYKGTWHETARMYRAWANSWWNKDRVIPQWVREMNSWQRIILKHQYGEYFFHYNDINGHIKEVGESVDCNSILCFGWWKEGMDNGYPAYSPDDSQGGDEALQKEVKKFVADGGNFMLYFNGKLIDRESDYYKKGNGRSVCLHDNTGADLTEQYRFTGEGTFLGAANARTFVVADTRFPEWQKILLRHADRAIKMGATSVFYDQLGYAEAQGPWDLSREFPIMNVKVAKDKSEILKLIRNHIKQQNPDFGLGTEWLVDATCQFCDYIHLYPGPKNFTYWFRYAFPEVIFSDREMRDDTDVERRVNLTLLKGLRNDIEIYRCRDLIDKTPHYQAYLAKANAIKTAYKSTLVAGRFNDCLGFTSTNKKVEAKCFFSWDESEMTVVCANQLSDPQTVATAVDVPGYKLESSMTLGDAQASGNKVTLGQWGLAALHYVKK